MGQDQESAHSFATIACSAASAVTAASFGGSGAVGKPRIKRMCGGLITMVDSLRYSCVMAQLRQTEIGP